LIERQSLLLIDHDGQDCSPGPTTLPSQFMTRHAAFGCVAIYAMGAWNACNNFLA
jgi:hypothetical protein